LNARKCTSSQGERRGETRPVEARSAEGGPIKIDSPLRTNMNVKNTMKKWHHRIQTGNPCGRSRCQKRRRDSAQCKAVPRTLVVTKQRQVEPRRAQSIAAGQPGKSKSETVGAAGNTPRVLFRSRGSSLPQNKTLPNIAERKPVPSLTNAPRRHFR